PILQTTNENANEGTGPGSTVESCIDCSEPAGRTLVTASWLLARTPVYSFRTCSSFWLWPRHRGSGRQKKRHEPQLSSPNAQGYSAIVSSRPYLAEKEGEVTSARSFLSSSYQPP